MFVNLPSFRMRYYAYTVTYIEAEMEFRPIFFIFRKKKF